MNRLSRIGIFNSKLRRGGSLEFSAWKSRNCQQQLPVPKALKNCLLNITPFY